MNQEVKISEIQIVPVKPKDGLIGFASFVIDEKYYVGSVAIFTRLGKSGYRLVYPSKKLGEKNINLFHPINHRAGEIIEEEVTKRIEQLMNSGYINEQG